MLDLLKDIGWPTQYAMCDESLLVTDDDGLSDCHLGALTLQRPWVSNRVFSNTLAWLHTGHILCLRSQHASTFPVPFGCGIETSGEGNIMQRRLHGAKDHQLYPRIWSAKKAYVYNIRFPTRTSAAKRLSCVK